MTLHSALMCALRGEPVVLVHRVESRRPGRPATVTIIPCLVRDGELWLTQPVPRYERDGLSAREGRYELAKDV